MTASNVAFTKRAPAAVVVGAAGVILGVAAALGWSAVASSQNAPPATVASADVTPIDEAALDGPRTASSAASPELAVSGFLDAERDGDYRASFTFLSAADRAALASEAGWIASHADLMPPVVDFEIGLVTERTVATTVVFEPSLDEFAGLVPGRADVTWTVAEDGGGWGVELESRVVEPILPSDGDATTAVERWAASRRACGAGAEVEHQWAGQPLGSPALADQLCATGGTAGTAVVGDAELLAPTDATPFVAAFGGDVLTYLRVVPISAPVPMRTVVAPVGDRWLVVGILPG